MNNTIAVARSCASRAINDACADTLRAVAEASVREPASAGLIARLNPGCPRSVTLRALEHLHEIGLVAERHHALGPLLAGYTLTQAGRAWLRLHG